jgi:hypothetical protein
MAKRSGKSWGEGTFAARPPHPILHVATIELPSPRKRGEGVITTIACAVISHHFSNSRSRSRGAFFCARGFASLLRSPKEGVAERRETYGCLRGIRWACTIGAGQAPSEAPCVPIRGTPASRRSHRGDFGRRGRASPHRHCGRIGHSELPRPGRSARRGAPASRGDGCESPPRDATPRSAFRMPPDDAPSMSKAGNAYSIGCKLRQDKNAICMEIFYVVISARRLYLSFWQPLQLAGRARW